MLAWKTSEAGADVLVLPVRAPTTNCLLGLLLLGPAEDGQAYAGADLERVMQVVETAAPWLAEVQQQEQEQRQDRFLDQMYHGLALVPTRHAAEEVIRGYAELIVSFGASVEVVWPDIPASASRLRLGTGPWLTLEETCALLADEERSLSFDSSGEGAWSCALLRLPFVLTSSRLILLVTYPHPYVFLSRERAYWQVLAQHCQDRLEAIALREDQADAWMEQATFLTAWMGNLDLALQGEFTDAQAYLSIQRAVEAAQHLVKTPPSWSDPPAPSSSERYHKRG